MVVERDQFFDCPAIRQCSEKAETLEACLPEKPAVAIAAIDTMLARATTKNPNGELQSRAGETESVLGADVEASLGPHHAPNLTEKFK